MTRPALSPQVFAGVLLSLLASCSRHSSSSSGPAVAVTFASAAPVGSIAASAPSAVHDNAPSAPSVKRLDFSFDTPSGWVDATAADEDKNHVVVIDGPDTCFFRVSDSMPVPVEESLEIFVAEEKPGLFEGAPKETTFAEWGGLHGAGKELSGKTKFHVESRIRIFAYTNEKHTWAVIESCPAEDWAKNESAFVAIRKSFKAID